MQIRIRYEGAATARFGNMLGALGDQAPKAMMRAINHQGDIARTAVRRALARQMNVGVRIVGRAMRTRRASARSGRLEYEILSSGKDLSLKYFKARQTLEGVSAAPLGIRRIYPRTFNTGGSFEKGRKKVLGGHVFLRTTTRRNSIERQYGPSVPEQMVQGASLAAFEKAAEGLVARLDHEIGFILKGF